MNIATINPDDNLPAKQFSYKGLNRHFSYIRLALVFPFLVRRIKPDIIHSHYATFYGFIASASFYKPHILSAYGSDIYQVGGFFKLLTKIALLGATLLTYDSINLGKKIKGILGSRKRGIKLIYLPFGVDSELFSKEILNPVLNDFTIISTRQLTPRYDVKTLIKSIPEVINHYPKTKFVIIGIGSQQGNLQKLVQELGIINSVKFLGRKKNQEEFVKCFLTADIFVSTALTDSTSVSLLEAMSSSLLPIVTDLPDNREWIKHGINGYIFKRGDEMDLAEKIIQAISSYPEMINALQMNREMIIEKASIAITSERLIQALSTI